MLVWLYGESKRVEELNAESYGKPKNGGVSSMGEEDSI